MRILHIITTLTTGGAEKLIVDSLPIYTEKLNNVDLAILKHIKPETFFYKKLKGAFKGKIYCLSGGTVYNPFLIFRIVPLLRKYDLIHIHLFPTIYWVIIAKLISFSSVKIVFTEHNTNNRRRNIKIFKFLDRFIYSKINFIGCISEGTKSNLVNHLNTESQKISVIQNGIHLEDFMKNFQVKDRFGFSEDSFILIQVSSFREQKDQSTVIKSLMYLPDTIKLVFAGDGHLKSENINLAKELGVIDRVRFLGNRSDVPFLMHSSDVCVLSSFYEGFGLAIVEGMASKLPSIATNVEGIKEIVNGYGLLFETQNSEQLANIIYKLFSNKEFYDVTSLKCFQRSKDFDINVMVDKYIQVYKDLINN